MAKIWSACHPAAGGISKMAATHVPMKTWSSCRVRITSASNPAGGRDLRTALRLRSLGSCKTSLRSTTCVELLMVLILFSFYSKVFCFFAFASADPALTDLCKPATGVILHPFSEGSRRDPRQTPKATRKVALAGESDPQSDFRYWHLGFLQEVLGAFNSSLRDVVSRSHSHRVLELSRNGKSSYHLLRNHASVLFHPLRRRHDCRSGRRGLP